MRGKLLVRNNCFICLPSYNYTRKLLSYEYNKLNGLQGQVKIMLVNIGDL